MGTTIKSFVGDRNVVSVINQMKATKVRRQERERKSSLNVSLSKDDTDISDEGIESPRCAAFL